MDIGDRGFIGWALAHRMGLWRRGRWKAFHSPAISYVVSRHMPMAWGAPRGHGCCMPDYRRVWVPGGTFFFTVNLLERRNRHLLVEHIDHLRAAFRYAQRAGRSM